MMKEEFCARAKVEENELSNEDYEVIEDEIRSIGRQTEMKSYCFLYTIYGKENARQMHRTIEAVSEQQAESILQKLMNGQAVVIMIEQITY
ncbi:MAG: hypothetical protein RSC06_00670 [Clostridia bacterium]